MKSLLDMFDLNESWNDYKFFRKVFKFQMYRKYIQLFHAYGRREGRMDWAKLIGVWRITKAPKTSFYYIEGSVVPITKTNQLMLFRGKN
jgi:hypothetical protein